MRVFFIGLGVFLSLWFFSTVFAEFWDRLMFESGFYRGSITLWVVLAGGFLGEAVYRGITRVQA